MPASLPDADHVDQLFLHGVRDEARADFEIVDPPAQHQLVDERHQREREQRQHDA